MNSNARSKRRQRALLVAPALLVAAAALVSCFTARTGQLSASPAAFAAVPRLAEPALPATMYAYAASADSGVARLAARGPQGGRGGRGPGGGPGFGGPPGGGPRGGGPPGGGPPGGGPGGGGRGGRGGFARAIDNTPASNLVTDAGATLGRVLFYDRQLSANNRVACASCHMQAFGFSDTARLSKGFAGGSTKRHSMALANARFYANGRFFWDERASTLEAQVLMPVQDPVEMGMNLSVLDKKLSAIAYYQPLFQAAFGTPEVTSNRIAQALAQFVRSFVSTDSRFDRSSLAVADFTPQEREGQRLFNGQAGCARCHVGNTLAADGTHNTGLDAAITDSGSGRGRFKVPSLRNIAVRAPYMHDGRFTTLEQVVDHYAGGVKNNPALDQRLRSRGGAPIALGLSASQKSAIVAYMRTFTDSTFLTALRFSDPFVQRSFQVRGTR